MNLLLLALALLGIIISLAFLLEDGKISTIPKNSLIGRVCRPDECKSVLQTEYASFLGLRNYAWGLGYYSLNAMFSIAGWQGRLPVFISLLAAFFSGYLLYVLLLKLKIKCLLCFAAHFLNLMILVIILNPGF